MNRIFRSALFYLLLIALLVFLVRMYQTNAARPERLESVNDWVEMVESSQIESAKFVPGMLEGSLITYLLVPGGSMFAERVPFPSAGRLPVAKRGNLLFIRNEHVFVISIELAERVVEGRHFGKTTAEEDDILRSRLNDIVSKMAVTTASATAPTITKIGVVKAMAVTSARFAREIATSYDLPLRLPSIQPDAVAPLAPVAIGESDRLTVALEDAELCPRYAAAIAEVTPAVTPPWMAHRLHAAGVRPISPLVDITNYVLMELGHPMHAFDLARLDGGGLRIRRARPGEQLTTLDGVARTLDREVLVIADRQRAQAIAGVMGGGDSEVTGTTRVVAFESAYFKPSSVRRTSKRLGLKTEASARFVAGNHHFFLNLTMAACKCAWLAAGPVAGSSVVSLMARNGTAMGIQLAGLPGRWFTAPAAPVQDTLLREGFAAEDAALDIGDSAVIECTGLGGMALAAAPAVAAFFGGDAAAAAERMELMGQICTARSSRFSSAGRGTPVGIDARLVAELAITPQITTGVLHASSGAGQIGAGVAHQPVEPFRAAVAALADALAAPREASRAGESPA